MMVSPCTAGVIETRTQIRCAGIRIQDVWLRPHGALHFGLHRAWIEGERDPLRGQVDVALWIDRMASTGSTPDLRSA